MTKFAFHKALKSTARVKLSSDEELVLQSVVWRLKFRASGSGLRLQGSGLRVEGWLFIRRAPSDHRIFKP